MSEAAHQRLDAWLWCARFGRSRAACTVLVEQGCVRVNRQPTEKGHYRVRVGDVLTLAVREAVQVVRVLGLARRRGPAVEARTLYGMIEADAVSCALAQSSPHTRLAGSSKGDA